MISLTCGRFYDKMPSFKQPITLIRPENRLGMQKCKRYVFSGKSRDYVKSPLSVKTEGNNLASKKKSKNLKVCICKNHLHLPSKDHIKTFLVE